MLNSTLAGTPKLPLRFYAEDVAAYCMYSLSE